MSEARGHVEQMWSMIGSPTYGYLLEHGREWEYVHDPEWRLPEGVERGEFKNCFENAGRHALGLSAADNMRYVEGFAWCGTIPVHHAWLVDENDRVIDPTWIHDGSCGFCLGTGEREVECDCELEEEDIEYGIDCYQSSDHGLEECWWCHGSGVDPNAERESEERSYFGIEITPEQLRASVLRTGTWGVFDDRDFWAALAEPEHVE